MTHERIVFFAMLFPSIILHEVSHGWVAIMFGDDTAKRAGRLTLNPIAHIDPFGTIILPAILILTSHGAFGYAKPVPVDPRQLRDPRNQSLLVSLAGPATNLVFAIVVLVVTRVFWEPEHVVFWAAMAFLGFLQVTAFVLNMLPVPGLDGYSALEPHLSAQTQRLLEPAKGWAFFVLLLLLFTPQVNRWFFGLVLWFFDASGVPRQLIGWGMDLTRFWSAWF